jgi:PhnB protein
MTTDDSYRTVTPYLMTVGVPRLIDFLTRAFGATETERHGSEDGSMHAEVRIGDTVVMMGQGSKDWPPGSAHLYLYVDDCDATYRRALDAGGTPVGREPADQDYGHRTAAVKDPSGNIWWIASPLK